MSDEPILDAVLTARRLAALELAAGREASANEIAAVGQATDPDAAAWAFSQIQLRRQAHRKFERSAEMFFTRDALEMASHEEVARFHAARFPAGVFVADLTCGIGSDLIALSERGPAVGFDIDFTHAAYAQHNVRVHGQSSLVRASDCLCFQHLHHVPGQDEGASEGIQYAYADPARRTGGRRHARLEDYVPSVADLATWMRRMRLGLLKLSPMLPDAELESIAGRIEFVGHQWECKEALITLGADAQPGRFAVLVESGQELPAGGTRATQTQPRDWILEAHPCAIRAHALPALGAETDSVLLGHSNGFLTAAQPSSSAWVRNFEVLATVPARPKDVRRWCADHNAKPTAVKPRALPIEPEAWMRQFRELSGEPVEVLVYPGDRGQASICRRLAED